MKILVIGNTGIDIARAYSWFVKNVYEGVSILGHEVRGIDFHSISTDVLRNKIYEYKPEIIFTHLTFHKKGLQRLSEILELYGKARKKFGCKIVHYLFDGRSTPRYYGDISHAFDCAFVSQTESISKLSQIWRIPVYFSHYACQKYKEIGKFDKSINIGNKLVYTGNIGSYPEGRGKFLKDLQKIMDLQIFITQSKNDMRNKTLKLSATAKIILSISSGYNIKHFIDTRPWQYLGAGAFLIQKVFKDMKDIIPSNLFAPFYDFDTYLVKDLYDYWMNNKKERKQIQKRAFDFMQKYHTCDRRMKDTLNVIFEKREKIRIFRKDL